MFIQWALSAFPDLTPSHNGNAAAEEVRSQPLRSISVQPAAGSAAGDEGMLVFICSMKAQKQFVQQLVKVDRMEKLLLTDLWRKHRNLTTAVSYSSLRRRKIWTFWELGPHEGTSLVFLHVALRIKALIVGAAMSERMPGPSSPEPPPPAPQGKHRGVPRRDEWYNSSSSLGLPWGLLKVGYVSLIFIVYIYYLYTVAASRRVNGCSGVCQWFFKKKKRQEQKTSDLRRNIRSGTRWSRMNHERQKKALRCITPSDVFYLLQPAVSSLPNCPLLHPHTPQHHHSTHPPTNTLTCARSREWRILQWWARKQEGENWDQTSRQTKDL